MTLDWWGLGLQAVNVLILVWLLSRVFWRPVAGAIARRQEAAQVMLDEGQRVQAKAEAALAEVAEVRAGIAAERDTILAEAKAAADTIAKAALKDAQTKADTLLAAARTDIDRQRNTARKENATSAAELSVEIAAHLLGRFNTAEVRASFLARLVEAISGMSSTDRLALKASAAEIEIVAATDPDDAEKTRIERAVEGGVGRHDRPAVCHRSRVDRRTGTAQRAFRAAQQLAGRPRDDPQGGRECRLMGRTG
jgi:F-type H+-transporting ATPase subunit b